MPVPANSLNNYLLLCLLFCVVLSYRKIRYAFLFPFEMDFFLLPHLDCVYNKAAEAIAITRTTQLGSFYIVSVLAMKTREFYSLLE